MKMFFNALIVLFIVCAGTLDAQSAAPAGITHEQSSARLFASASAVLAASAPLSAAAVSSGGMPRWLKWGIVGAVGGAVAWTLVRAGSNNAGSVVGNAAAGAITGFILVGGGVALYDWACHSGSRRC